MIKEVDILPRRRSDPAVFRVKPRAQRLLHRFCEHFAPLVGRTEKHLRAIVLFLLELVLMNTQQD